MSECVKCPSTLGVCNGITGEGDKMTAHFECPECHRTWGVRV